MTKGRLGYLIQILKKGTSQQFHMELPVALGTGGAPSSLWEDDSLGVMSAKGALALEEGTSFKA